MMEKMSMRAKFLHLNRISRKEFVINYFNFTMVKLFSQTSLRNLNISGNGLAVGPVVRSRYSEHFSRRLFTHTHASFSIREAR